MYLRHCFTILFFLTIFHRVTVMAVFGEPAKQNTFSGIALARQSGKVEIQYFKESLTVLAPMTKKTSVCFARCFFDMRWILFQIKQRSI